MSEIDDLIEVMAGLAADEFARWMESEGFTTGGNRSGEVSRRVVALMAEAWFAGQTRRASM